MLVLLLLSLATAFSCVWLSCCGTGVNKTLGIRRLQAVSTVLPLRRLVHFEFTPT